GRERRNMPATNAVPDRAEAAIIETSLQKSFTVRRPFGARHWHVPCVSSLGIRHLPGSSRGSLLQLQYTLKSCRFQKCFATNCPAAMVDVEQPFCGRRGSSLECQNLPL